MTRRKQYPLRIDSQVWAAIEQWATDDMRSANSQVEWILREALKREGRLPQTDGASPNDAQSNMSSSDIGMRR
ncbi:Arc family DNA-binding protein [Olsenella sp. Marseille-P4559]|uniref:Arc family DNA-binding protein n=1 Tax=Olsenella sp. Marseille-P4559 TaxID=2364795 RepID=UPI001031B0C4|nr:Arc family DNA-binding protein [Olsenella sp. Marseille-P4559]